MRSYMTAAHTEIFSPRLKTLLGSFRREIEEADDIPETLASFVSNGVNDLRNEVRDLAKRRVMTRDIAEDLTGCDLENNERALRFFEDFCRFVEGKSADVPDIYDY